MKAVYQHKKILDNLRSSDLIQKWKLKTSAIAFGEGFPGLIYYGFNFNENEILNFKIYVVFFRRLNEKEVKCFLSDCSDFFQYYSLWHDSKSADEIHTGQVFAYKLDTRNIATEYFYYRVNGFPLGLPQYIKLLPCDLKLQHGISFEYTHNVKKEKKYFTITDKIQINELLDSCGLKGINKPSIFPDWLEYSETLKSNKILIGLKKFSDIEMFTKEIKWVEMKKLITHLQKKEDITIIGHGIYQDMQQRAIYYIDKNNKQNYFKLLKQIFG